MGRRYIVKQRARIDTITGPVNLPYGTTVEAVEDYLIHQGRQLCTVASRKAHLYFARDDDGKGRERGALTLAITKRLEKRDKDHQARWDRVWEDPVCQLHGLGLYDHIHSVDDGAQIRRQFGVVHGRHPLVPIRAAMCRRSSTGASKNAWPHIK